MTIVKHLRGMGLGLVCATLVSVSTCADDAKPGQVKPFASKLVATQTVGKVVRITTDGVFKRDPRFIEGGSHIMYCFDENPALIRMMKLKLGEKEARPMFNDAGNKHHIEPVFSPNGRYIVFTECTGNLTARLVLRDLQAKMDAYITHAGRGGTRSPVISPDSQLVVYAFAETGPQQLWTVRPDGKEKKQLTRSQGISNWPSFLPDGKRIVFANSRENNYEIYSMNLNGTDEKRLTKNKVMDIRPMVSPDGSQVAFTIMRDGNYEVYVMNIDGSNVRRLTHHEERDDYPAWHPNGRQLVIVSERDGQHDLYLIDVPKTNKQVTSVE